MDFTRILAIILWIIIIGWIIFEIVQFFRRRNAAEPLTNEAFRKNIRKAQVIDVREKKEYRKSHILGARNIPFTQFKQRLMELRKDQPIYLYEDGKTLSLRAAMLLKKENYKDIYYLKEGFKNWDGKTKGKS